jgi:TetR/AcrR family transcriptional repressor of mexJK operon
MLEERFAALAAEGALRTPDPGLAARHFTALTISLALETVLERREPGTEPAFEATVEAVIADGVDAFLRAYR